ncbi:hypothetical protein BDP27DRAFT_1361468 [Rhodocollybia butyracea]|uniref:Uncharacterized protein n=1 Tax=Rhodocollybia butyracea TaxID=206335 RepID=A0A9P5Q0D0_9AGAR|nr:hypothetical protein BDP27DRAFT_1361468 [Rhodocollybia butyracea]
MLGLVAQIWFNVHAMLFKKPVKAQKLLIKIVLFLPYIVFSAITAEALAVNSVPLDSSDIVHTYAMHLPVWSYETRFSKSYKLRGRISAAVVAIILAPAVVIEMSLRRYWAIFRSPDTSPNKRNIMSMMIRIFVFSVFGVVALILSVFFVATIHHGAALNVVVSFLPVVAVLIFGTQTDLLGVWMPWKWKWWRTRRSSDTRFKVSFDSGSTLESPVSTFEEKGLPPLPV